MVKFTKMAARRPVLSKERPRGMYWGSVRFFKHLILAVITLMIAIPAGLCILWDADSQA